MENQFEKYHLSEEIMDALNVLGYHVPTPVQEQVLPYALESKDILAKSWTGSGKTAAFAIPICEKVIWDYNIPQALVLEPTRELTVQVKEEMVQIGRKKRIKVADLIGGFPIDKQIRTIKQKTHVVIGTPGRVLDHIRRETLELSMVNTIVIDEADLMLDMGFIDEVKSILDQVSGKPQILLFSATMSDSILELARQYQQDAVSVILHAPEEMNAETFIEEKLYEVGLEEKYEMFRKVLIKENPEHAMIFCGTKEMVNVLCRKLGKDGIKCGMIHGDIDQGDRLRTIQSFRDGRIRYLIATDVIARGIDFEKLSHVFNYDFPTGRETYVHRIGRTGRNGAKGTAVSFVTPDDERMRQMVETFVSYKIPVEEFHELSQAEFIQFQNTQKEKPKARPKKGAGFDKEIMKLSIGGGKKSKIRSGDLVGAISNIDGVQADDIGVIDVRDSLSYVEILNGKGNLVLQALQERPIKGKLRKVKGGR